MFTHPLTVLQDCGLVRREVDALRRNRSVYRIGEPLIAFDHVVSRTKLALLDRGPAEQVWESSGAPFLSAVVGPHFEQICREWVARFAVPETFGGMPIDVSYGTVADPGAARLLQRRRIHRRAVERAGQGRGRPRRPAAAVRGGVTTAYAFPRDEAPLGLTRGGCWTGTLLGAVRR